MAGMQDMMKAMMGGSVSDDEMAEMQSTFSLFPSCVGLRLRIAYHRDDGWYDGRSRRWWDARPFKSHGRSRWYVWWRGPTMTLFILEGVDGVVPVYTYYTSRITTSACVFCSILSSARWLRICFQRGSETFFCQRRSSLIWRIGHRRESSRYMSAR